MKFLHKNCKLAVSIGPKQSEDSCERKRFRLFESNQFDSTKFQNNSDQCLLEYYFIFEFAEIRTSRVRKGKSRAIEDGRKYGARFKEVAKGVATGYRCASPQILFPRSANIKKGLCEYSATVSIIVNYHAAPLGHSRGLIVWHDLGEGGGGLKKFPHTFLTLYARSRVSIKW